MTYATGSLVHARGRVWVVRPESEEGLPILRPLGATDAKVTGLCLPPEGGDLRPPHPAEPRQAELAVKFHNAAELVLPATLRRLERC